MDMENNGEREYKIEERINRRKKGIKITGVKTFFSV